MLAYLAVKRLSLREVRAMAQVLSEAAEEKKRQTLAAEARQDALSKLKRRR